MFIRNGIKSILRERGRTVLFSLLIMLLTVTMILSLSVLLYTTAVKNACNKAYRSIALVEYMGSEYPNEDEPDAAAREAAAKLKDEEILAIPGVNGWTRGSTAFASVEGYGRRSGVMPYKNRSVIVVSQVSNPIEQWVKFDTYNQPLTEEGSITYYTCLLKTSLYSREGKEGAYIDILLNDSGFVPEYGKSYILNGSFVDASGTTRKMGGYPLNGYDVFKVESFLSGDALPYADYTEGMEIPEAFLNAVEQYQRMNNYVQIVPCQDVRDVYAFHQNELRLAEGKMPDPETPYACVVSNDLATQMGLKPGDTFSIDALRGTSEDRYRLVSTGERQTLTVSGVAYESNDFKGTVWVVAENIETPLFGYLLGTVSLDNAKAEEAVEALRALVPAQVRVTALDQGYGSAVQPFLEVEKTAVNVLLICAAGIVAILLLFAFLYVGRQQSTVKILVSMGTPSRDIAAWFLSGALVICGGAAVLGAVLGVLLRPRVFRMIAEMASRGGNSFLWYSETAVGVVKQTAYDPQVPIWPNFLVVPVIVVVALLLCLRFLRMARQGGTRKQGKSRVRVPRGKTTSMRVGGLGFALLSIRRGGLRSLVVPLVSFVLTLTLLILGGMYQGWQNKLDDALENTRIEGMTVSLNGRSYSGLVLPVANLRKLMGVEGVEDVAVSYGYHYWLTEDEPGFTYGSYGREHRQAWIDAQPEMVALNSLSAAKEFYYADPEVAWLEGWDETALAEPDYRPMRNRNEEQADEKLIPAVCSTAFLEAHDMVLGDTFLCYVRVEHSNADVREIPLNVQAVGSYVLQGGKDQIYVPLACHIPMSLLDVNEDPNSIIRWDRYNFRTCRFYLSCAGELDTVRQLLRDQEFSAVGHITSNRVTLILKDASFLQLKENMERNIAMGKVLSSVISLLVVLLGFLVSWLMIYSRRMEFALMRGCGAQRRRVFASFFLEQGLLCLGGCLVGCIGLCWLYAGGMVQSLVVAAYLVCYLLGATISILMIGRSELMKILAVRE